MQVSGCPLDVLRTTFFCLCCYFSACVSNLTLDHLYFFSFRISIPLRPVRNWDCTWGPEDDSNFLIGIFEYGMGSWEQIQSDPTLQLNKKVIFFSYLFCNCYFFYLVVAVCAHDVTVRCSYWAVSSCAIGKDALR